MKRYRLSELNPQRIARLCRRSPSTDPAVMETCRAIFEAVASGGDSALRRYTLQYDRVRLSELRVSGLEFAEAEKQVGVSARKALEHAARNIEKFHAAQRRSEAPVEVEPGVCCWRETRPIERVGLYVPGGSAILPSTLLMLGIPARLAGCRRVVVCAPPRSDAAIAPEVLVAAKMAGIEEVFKVGGAQAVAALALGTRSVPRVDKICGPGNRWVQAGKLLAALRGVAIDMVAGPTEVLVVADDSAPADWVAADLVSQAEHDADSRAVLISTSGTLLDEASRLAWQQVEDLPRRELAARALQESFCLLASSLEEALDFANQYAPEHLILHLKKPRRCLKDIRSAGSVFVGSWTPEVAGDYASGTNHTLPTSGLARAYSGVSLDTFVKQITFQEIRPRGLKRLAPTLSTLAAMEGLEGHRRAVSMRLGSSGEERS